MILNIFIKVARKKIIVKIIFSGKEIHTLGNVNVIVATPGVWEAKYSFLTPGVGKVKVIFPRSLTGYIT